MEGIKISEGKRFGRACVRDTRLSVGDVLGYMASGMSRQEIMDDFPGLTEQDITNCLGYAANVLNRVDNPV